MNKDISINVFGNCCVYNKKQELNLNRYNVKKVKSEL